MKLKGKMFTYPKNVNEVTIQSGRMAVHNHDGDDGYLYMIEVDGEDDLKFVLNKRDFKQLSLFDEFDLTMKNDVIKVKAGNVKLTLANLIEYEVSNPRFDNLMDVNVEYEDLFNARVFTGISDTRIQTQGVNINKDCVVASDGGIFYEKKLDTEISESINIPKEAFKNIPLIDEVRVQTNGNLARFIFDGCFYYTKLIGAHIPGGVASKYAEAESSIEITVNKNEFIEKLNLIKNYDKYVDFVFENRKVQLSGMSEIERIDINLMEKSKSEANIKFTYNIDKLKTLLNIIDKEKVLIKIVTNGCLMLGMKETALILPYARSNQIKTQEEK